MEFKYLKKYVGNRIEELTSLKAYSKKAPDNETITYPYIVYNFPGSQLPVRNRIDWICEIDFYNNTNDSTVIMEKAELLKSGFDYYYQSEDEGFYQSHIEFFGEIPQDIPDLSRINQRYYLKVR